jgi:hypothetical protein
MADHTALLLGLSLAASVATIAALHLKSWLRGERDENPPVARHVAAYFFAYLAGFTSLTAIGPPWSSLVIAVVSALAFAVTMNGTKPLMSAAYVRTASRTVVALLAFWGVYQLLLLAGIDLLAKDFIARA